MSSSRFIDIYNNAIEQTSFEENYFVKKFAAHNDFKKDVAKCAHEYHTKFSDKFGKVIVISISDFDKLEGSVLYISPKSVKALHDQVGKVKRKIDTFYQIKEVFEYSSNYFQEKNGHFNSGGKRSTATLHYDYNNVFNKIVALKEGATLKSAQNLNGLTTDQYIKKMFKHEAGHALTKKGLAEGSIFANHVAEKSADAFQGIEFYAENGYNDWYYNVNNFSSDVVLGTSPIHYTNVIAYAVRNLSKEVDLTALKIHQRVCLADMVTHEYSENAQILKPIVDVFSDVAKYHKRKDHDVGEGLKLHIDIMLANTDNHDAYRAGREFVKRIKLQQFLKTPQAVTDVDLSLKLNALACFEKESGVELDPAKAIDAETELRGDVPFIDRVKEKFPVLHEEKQEAYYYATPQPLSLAV